MKQLMGKIALETAIFAFVLTALVHVKMGVTHPGGLPGWVQPTVNFVLYYVVIFIINVVAQWIYLKTHRK